MTCVASSSSSWAQSLPYSHSTPMRPSSATWNTKFPSGLDLTLDLPYTPASSSRGAAPKRPVLRLALPRFDPFADEPPLPSASTSHHHQQSQNTPPRGRPLTPLVVASASAPSPAPAPAPAPVQGRRRAPSFSAGCPRSVVLSRAVPLPISAPAPPPAPAPAPPSVPLAPSPFHARHYPTPDARARLLARTLLNRIHAVGRPRSPYASCYSNGYESECGARGYVPSRLSECVAAC
ncbi:hypothetical protein DFH09DRAFT_1169878 [Mycena vulgaris]|nr:hypothetical protein DFH09DRAFT_1169878 [Mycena vulgaris]